MLQNALDFMNNYYFLKLKIESGKDGDACF